jgi:hypothetical protein
MFYVQICKKRSISNIGSPNRTTFLGFHMLFLLRIKACARYHFTIEFFVHQQHAWVVGPIFIVRSMPKCSLQHNYQLLFMS